MSAARPSALLLLATVCALTGCAARRPAPPALVAPAPPMDSPSLAHAVRPPDSAARILTRDATLQLSVTSLDDVGASVERIAHEYEGYVASADQAGRSASFELRVPAARLDEAIAELAKLGRKRALSISARDVTEEVVDLEARLRSKVQLRDRVRELLGRTQDVKEILAVEEQLGRLQGEIEALEGKLALLRSQVSLSRIHLTVERRLQPGPLGYVFGGLAWGLGKLFVLR